MLRAFPGTTDNSLSEASWIDIVDPTPAEIAAFEKGFNLRVPVKAEVSEIETTSRLQVERGALYMTAPLILATGDEPWIAAPTGFVLSKTVFLTVRFVQSAIFDSVSKELNVGRLAPTLVYVCVLEGLVDHMADLLEASSQALDDASHVIFRPDNLRRLSREASLLRRLLVRTGRTSERMARINYTLVCVDRMAKFTIERGREWLEHEQISRLQSVSADIASLEQYAEGLINRIQLLRDRNHQCRPEQSNENPDHRLGCRNSPGFDCRNLWNELQEYAGAELGVGLSFCFNVDRADNGAATALVQMEGLDVMRLTAER